MTPVENATFEGQALFLRAWTFFHMVKTLGGLSIVGDQVFSYVGGDDVVPLQLKRNSEIDCYRYILQQCDLAATKLTVPGSATGTIPAAQNVNGALANKWACKMLKARAALTAASLAKWTPANDATLQKWIIWVFKLMVSLQVKLMVIMLLLSPLLKQLLMLMFTH